MTIHELKKVAKGSCIHKYCNIRPYKGEEKKTIQHVQFETEGETFSEESFLVYFFTIDGVIVKVGQSSSPSTTIGFYEKLSLNMSKGRFIPHYYFAEQLKEGKQVEMWVECVDQVYVEYPHAITKEPVQHLAVFAKDREKQYIDYIKQVEGVPPLLNRQEGAKKIDSFERKYFQMYEKEGGRVK